MSPINILVFVHLVIFLMIAVSLLTIVAFVYCYSLGSQFILFFFHLGCHELQLLTM